MVMHSRKVDRCFRCGTYVLRGYDAGPCVAPKATYEPRVTRVNTCTLDDAMFGPYGHMPKHT